MAYTTVALHLRHLCRQPTTRIRLLNVPLPQWCPSVGRTFRNGFSTNSILSNSCRPCFTRNVAHGLSGTGRYNPLHLLRQCRQPGLSQTRHSRLFVRTYASNGGRTGAAGGGGAGRGVPRPKVSEIRRLLALAKPERFKLAAAIVFLLLSSAVTMAVPYGIGHVIDIIYTYSQQEGSHMVERLKKFCALLLCVFVCGALANFGRVYLMQTIGNRVVKRLREQVFGSIMKQDIAFFDKNKTGELINRLSSDTSLVGQSITMNISDGLRAVAQAAGGISLMIYMSPKLAMISLSIIPPLFLLSRMYGRYVQRITKEVQDSLAGATQVAEERLANIRTVRAFVQEGRETELYDEKITRVLNLTYKEALARGIFWGLTGLSGNIMVLSVFYYGGMLMSEAQITVGELSSFLMYAAFSGVSIAGLGSFYTELMRGIGASKRLWQLIDRQPTIPYMEGTVPCTELQGHLEFKDVYFSYPSRVDTPVFNGLSLTVQQGSALAVVGSSGSGKSTLAALLLRYYDPDQGSVLVDGVDVCELSPYWMRSHMGIVSQEPLLFSTSIADNISYGALDPGQVTPQHITEAARKANAYHFITGFPQGFDTLVGERGIMLSGGQKQRIAIARAIIKNPKILLLDEATSALDAESEYLVQEALERVMVGRTVIIIAHRLSTIKNAHQIAVLDQGRVAETGSYQQLMEITDGMFRKLVERQTISQ